MDHGYLMTCLYLLLFNALISSLNKVKKFGFRDAQKGHSKFVFCFFNVFWPFGKHFFIQIKRLTKSNDLCQSLKNYTKLLLLIFLELSALSSVFAKDKKQCGAC